MTAAAKTKTAPASKTEAGETLELEPAVSRAQPLAVVSAAASATPGQLLQMAMLRGDADLDRMERLMRMQLEWEANEARKAFTVAMAAFKAEPLEIFKTKTVDFSSAKGRTHYKHAGLDDVVSVIAPALARHGLSHRWEPRQEGNRIIVRTVVTHIGGHSESVELEGAADDSGNKNPLQQRASTIQYLSRYGVLSILGLATKDMGDDDGRKGGDPQPTAAEEEKTAVFQDASLLGHASLRGTFEEWRKRPDWSDKWWQTNRTAFHDAATAADKDAAAKAAAETKQ